jgi:hypothetical protein
VFQFVSFISRNFINKIKLFLFEILFYEEIIKNYDKRHKSEAYEGSQQAERKTTE